MVGAALILIWPSCSVAIVMRGWLKLALVVGGYLAAFVIATAVVDASSAFDAWSAFAFLRIIVAPLFALGFFLATIFAPNRSARISLFLATLLEAAAFGGVALRLVLSAIAR